MQKKIKELKTVSSYKLEDFDNQATELIKDGFSPLMPVQLGVSTPSYGPDGRFNCGSTCYYAQQFVKYEEEERDSFSSLLVKIKKDHRLICVEDGTSTQGGSSVHKGHMYIASKDADNRLGFDSIRVVGDEVTDWDVRKFIVIQ